MDATSKESRLARGPVHNSECLFASMGFTQEVRISTRPSSCGSAETCFRAPGESAKQKSLAQKTHCLQSVPRAAMRRPGKTTQHCMLSRSTQQGRPALSFRRKLPSRLRQRRTTTMHTSQLSSIVTWKRPPWSRLKKKRS